MLLSLGFAVSLLALFQWMELLVVSAGSRSICSINQSINCETVWKSPLAVRVHESLGVPVAGLGLAWGLTAFGLSILLVHRLLRGASLRTPIVALRWVAAVGLGVMVVLIGGSVSAGALCITCMTTLALVIGYALAAARLLPGALIPTAAELRPALAWSAGLGLASYLAVLGPGLMTPKGNGSETALSQVKPKGEDPGLVSIKALISGMSSTDQQMLSDSLALYRKSPAHATSQFRVRNLHGSPTARTKIVEFTDVRCSHCAQLIKVMKQIESIVPAGRFSVEARNFPLDASCNPELQGSDGTGVRCLGAKVQICLEQSPDFWEIRERLFADQESLTPEKVLEIGSSGSVQRSDLEKCVASPDTSSKLSEDIAYAMLFSPQGTPLVVINGREVPPLGPFLFSMAMTGANPDSPVFASLPPPHPGGMP